MDSTVTVVCGMPTEQVAQIVHDLASHDLDLEADALELLRARLPEDTQFRLEAIASFFEILGREQVPPEELQDTFAQIASENLALRERLQVFEGDDPEIGRLREEAANALKVGDHERALEALREAEGLIEIEALEAELAERKGQRAEPIAELAHDLTAVTP